VVIGGTLRTTKYVGFLAMVLGVLLMACAAALPVSVDRGDPGVAGVRFEVDGCGPALHAALRASESQCQQTARHRLAVTTTVGLLMVVGGLVMFAGGDDGRSRVEVATGARRVAKPRHL
jgi:hypothetical protein